MGRRSWNVFAALMALICPLVSNADDPTLKHLYLCRSPMLTFEYWETLQQPH